MDSIATSPFAALTIIVAPAILTNAASVLSLGTGNRIARVVDRTRILAAEMPRDLCVGHHDFGRILQRPLVLLPKVIAPVIAVQQIPDPIDERLGFGDVNRAFFRELLVHLDNHLGERMEPLERGAVEHEAECRVRALDASVLLFVAATLGVDQRLVQGEETPDVTPGRGRLPAPGPPDPAVGRRSSISVPFSLITLRVGG